ncbi:probable RNA-directed DNA polymerase from transposon X-element [Trichonephila clavipes]|nr:probable RNA-directed DNA polymerase from transposon X-element [Trichonephila clavipes]
MAVVPDFHKRILFSDEAHFWLNGYVNKQNCRIWSEANPQVYVETPLHREKLTVWCALWAGGIIGPYFFKNDEGQIGLHPSQPDHFPIILSHDYDTGVKTFPPTYSYGRADWALFTQLAVIPDVMVKTEIVDTAVQEVTNVLIAAADLSIPKSSKYPTTENLLAFKKAKANARRVRRRSQRQSWIRYVSSLQRSVNNYGKRVWKEHCFPSSWREAIVIPNLKPGKVATDPLSYRPIALTSCFCKTFERMANTRLVYVLEKEKCISPLQSGFCKGRSTLDNLVFLESQIRDAFVRRNHLVSLFFDIEKAYDRTWCYGILRNMHDFGLRGNLPIFIFNFLAVRYFHVRIGHSSSHKFIQDQGVPQGSVLSVTLFNIHMSSILGHLPPSVRGMLYVYDLQVSLLKVQICD